MKNKKQKHNKYIYYSNACYKVGKRTSKTYKVLSVVILAVAIGLGVFFLSGRYLYNGREVVDNDEDLYNEPNDDFKSQNEPEIQKDHKYQIEGDTNTDAREPVRVKGLYITSSVAGDKTQMKELLEIADTTEINAMVIDVKNDSGRITYDMDNERLKQIGSISNAIPDMEALVSALKEKNIYLIARIVAFKDTYLAQNRQDLAIKNKDGSLYRDNKGDSWVNPYNKQVWEYLIEVSKEAAAIGFDEIQFDYIRFSTGVGMSDANIDEDTDVKTKEEIIIEFTQYAYNSLKPLGIFVSADVYGAIISSSIDGGLVGQNYVEMSKHLDYICPMIYPSHFSEGNYGVEHPDLEPFKIVRRILTASQEKLAQIPEGEHKAIVRPWLQAFTATWLEKHLTYGGLELREQIGGVYGAGYSEWLLWNAAGNYNSQGLRKSSDMQ